MLMLYWDFICRAIQYAVVAGQIRDNVSWLIANGADINQQDSAGNTALHFAAFSGQPKLVKQLLNMSASPQLCNKS